MAIDFPNSPTTGDTYTAGGRTWQWDGTVWAAYGNYPDPTVLKIDTGTNRVGINNTSPTTALDVTGDLTVSGTISGGSISGAGMTVSSTAPSSPSEGEMWYNEVSGRTFVYYDDGSSQQWVEFGVPPNGSKIALASYADSSARTTAIPSPSEADLSYLQDTNSVEVYDGSSWAAIGGGGKILQVVSTFIDGTFSTSSTSFVDITGHTATITPSSASNKVLVLYTTHTGPAAGRVSPLNLVRDGSTIAQPTGGAYAATAQFYQENFQNVHFNYLDSPATTSAVVYKIQTRTDAGTLFVNRNDVGPVTATSSLTLLEVSA